MGSRIFSTHILANIWELFRQAKFRQNFFDTDSCQWLTFFDTSKIVLTGKITTEFFPHKVKAGDDVFSLQHFLLLFTFSNPKSWLQSCKNSYPQYHAWSREPTWKLMWSSTAKQPRHYGGGNFDSILWEHIRTRNVSTQQVSTSSTNHVERKQTWFAW